MSITNLFLITFILTFSTLSVHSNTHHHHHHRRFLHQPFFPVGSHLLPPPPFPQPPLSSPKHPFSNSPTTTTTPPFFPLFPSSPPPPLLPPTTTFPTFPANISLALPQSSSKPISPKLVAIAVSLSLLSATLIAVFLLYHRRHHHRSKPSDTDRLRLVPPNTTPSDDLHKHPPPLRNSSPSTSSEFLYLGTLFNSREVEQKDLLLASKSVNVSQPSVSSAYRKMGSPELHPLPPLPRNNFRPSYLNPDDDDDDEEFFSPRGSSGRHLDTENFEIQNSNLATTSYQRSNSASPSLSSMSPKSSRSRSTEPPAGNAPSPSPRASPPAINTQNPMQRFGTRLPPPPPPLPPASFWETRPAVISFQMENRNEGLEISKPKLKPLHWDKVKASSDRAMVWDHLKSSSFQLNEEMIETLFMVNSTNLNAGKNHNPYFVMPSMNQENRVLLDPKKSQNISILLRAVNLTIDEICEALFEGNTDTMGTELLESLLKMAPTRDEEHKLKEFKDEEESPFKLGPAEKFLKSLLEIPFAFKRIEAMLYIANFDSEVDYLQTSFRTLEAASEELRNNRMFMKLLEAVLKTGNRMNVGTNRGDAHAFKLDTLLKLVDIKGTDRKTTLLHFVVEEIIRLEGSRLSGTDRNSDTGENPLSANFQEEKKLGLQVVSGLSGEFTNVKKVATMEYDALVSEVAKLGMGMGKVGEVLNLNEKLALKESSRKFSESMKGFLKKAEEEIMKIQVQESLALRKVKEITEYFHGNSSKEEAHPFRIFTVVRDFLSVLDKVCKEVGRINETSMGSSTRHFPLPASAPPVFPVFNGTARHNSSSDDDGNERSS